MSPILKNTVLHETVFGILIVIQFDQQPVQLEIINVGRTGFLETTIIDTDVRCGLLWKLYPM